GARADRQSGTEPYRGALRFRGGGQGRRTDAVLHPAAREGREGREGWGNQEGGRGTRPRVGAGPRCRRAGGEHARGYRGDPGGRDAGLCGGARDGGGRSRNAEGVSQVGRGTGGGGGARPDRAGLWEAARGRGWRDAAVLRPDLEGAVHERRVGHLRTRRAEGMRRRERLRGFHALSGRRAGGGRGAKARGGVATGRAVPVLGGGPGGVLCAGYTGGAGGPYTPRRWQAPHLVRTPHGEQPIATLGIAEVL
ncbi:MAG: ABC-type Fe3+-hydroxamate transport system, periplasmic component, partial [uncultured Rubrobacteraceae bacterium]